MGERDPQTVPGEVGAGSGEGFLNLINDNDHAGTVDATED
jgi:hypothetical protein